MRISDWSSDVCSSDLRGGGSEIIGETGILVHQCAVMLPGLLRQCIHPLAPAVFTPVGRARAQGGAQYRTGSLDRKSVVSGKSVSVRVDLGGRRIIKQKTVQQFRI